jgi:hypothetical protein
MGLPRYLNPVELRPYWYRWGGGDWGFQHISAFYKACKNQQDGRIHIYDEFSVSQVGSYELGILVANWWLPDLEGLSDKKITIALSHDAFRKDDATKSRAEQFSEGIKQVLGPYGAMLMHYTDDELAAMKKNPQYAKTMFDKRIGTQPKGQMTIAVKMASRDRIDGWAYIVDLLRFRPTLQETEAEIMARLKETFSKSGVEAYERERARVKFNQGSEVLPKLVIWKRCKGAIQFLMEAQHDDGPRAEDVRKVAKNYDDFGDALRYCLFSFKDVEAAMPKSYWLTERIDEFQKEYRENYGEELTDLSRLALVHATQSARFDKQNKGAGERFTFTRACSSRHR